MCSSAVEEINSTGRNGAVLQCGEKRAMESREDAVVVCSFALLDRYVIRAETTHGSQKQHQCRDTLMLHGKNRYS